MKRSAWMVMAVALALGTGALWGAAPAQAEETEAKGNVEEMIYGSQIMSAEERAAYRQQIMKATTAEERERIRAEHHEKMMVRAKAQGVTLPDPMPAGGMGQGRQMMGPKDGSGMGGGMKGK